MNSIKRRVQRLGIESKALLGLLVLILGTLLWVLAFTGGIASFFGGSTTTARADFQSIEDVVTNDPVRVDGVQVGSVGTTSVDPGGRGGTLTLNLDSGAPAIYRNASASIVWRTALGANDAVALNPGTRSAGLLGNATIPQSQDSNQVELDQITQAAFHGGAQQGLRTMLQQLAPAFNLNHATLNDDFNTLARIGPEATIGIGAVRGEVQDTDLENLISDTGKAAQALTVGTNGATTRAFVQSAATTLSALSASPPALTTTINYLGDDLQLMADKWTRLNHTVQAQLRPLIAKLIPIAPNVAPTLAALHPALANLDTLLHNATPLLHKLQPTVHSLANTANVGVPVINSLSPSLTRLVDTILPGLDQKGPEDGGRTTAQMLGGTFVGLGIGGFFDGDGHLGNLTVSGNAFNQTSPEVLPCSIDFTGKDLLVCETLSQALGTYTTLGTSLLQSLVKQPGGSALAPYAARAEHQNSLFANLQSKVTKLYPALGKWLFQPRHGQ